MCTGARARRAAGRTPTRAYPLPVGTYEIRYPVGDTKESEELVVTEGARTIVTSSSDDKLERMRALGAAETINYRTMPDWEAEVLRLTGGAGADRVVEVGGPGTLQKSIEATRVAGTIGLIGILAGGQINPLPIMRKSLPSHLC